MRKRYLGLLIIIGIGFGVITFINKKTYLSEDDVIGVYINNELYTDIPSKDSALFQKAVCDDENVSATWDSESWGLLLKNLTKKTKCNLYFYQGDTVYNFDYTGSEQTFTAPVSGTYKLETWGAQGGNSIANGSNYEIGGKGGYSSGYIKLSTNNILYINVGGKGENGILNQNDISGGYNGGGISHWDKRDDEASGGGGGATHMASISGILNNLENKKDSILIASGAGGGGSWMYGAGHGGGITGGSSLNPEHNTSSIGGNQLNGYKFGLGSDGIDDIGSPGGGGGGGYFGGNGGNDNGVSGAGGSGYIGNPLLKDKVMYCYNCEESSEESTKTISTTCSEETPTENCAKKGNGYARITLVSIDE